MPALLAIDQGTTSTRAMVFDDRGGVLAQAAVELPQHFPQPGWVEHDPMVIWRDARTCAQQALRESGVAASDLAGIGITNQRETTIVWRRDNGEPVYPAIVWQDRRTAAFCSHWATPARSALVAERTGLLVDPYFCASKLRWILDHVEGARAEAEAGRLAFGTVDSWLLWNLTGGRVHATDSTNAARTLLFDIRRHAWDDELLREFDIPKSLLPEVLECAAEFGASEPGCFGSAVPIRGIAGDQQGVCLDARRCCPGLIAVGKAAVLGKRRPDFISIGRVPIGKKCGLVVISTPGGSIEATAI